jgi:sugar lactone lactonase YvrE
VLREGNAVYRIDPKAGRIYHLAGTGESGRTGDGGPAKQARLAGPKGISWAPDGSVYIADTESHTIRRIDLKSGIITTVLEDLKRPHGVFVAKDGTVYVGDSEKHRVLALKR